MNAWYLGTSFLSALARHSAPINDSFGIRIEFWIFIPRLQKAKGFLAVGVFQSDRRRKDGNAIYVYAMVFLVVYGLAFGSLLICYDIQRRDK